jgi:hypothetical protein
VAAAGVPVVASFERWRQCWVLFHIARACAAAHIRDARKQQASRIGSRRPARARAMVHIHGHSMYA